MKVLLLVDDSVHSEAVVNFVTAAAWKPGTTFVVASACPPIWIGSGESAEAPAAAGDAVAALNREQQRYHRETAEQATRALAAAGLPAEARVPHGDPRRVLLEEAERMGADLIVVGSHGRSGIAKLVLGSVAAHVVTHAPCSVLVVRPKR